MTTDEARVAVALGGKVFATIRHVTAPGWTDGERVRIRAFRNLTSVLITGRAGDGNTSVGNLKNFGPEP